MNNNSAFTLSTAFMILYFSVVFMCSVGTEFLVLGSYPKASTEICLRINLKSDIVSGNNTHL